VVDDLVLEFQESKLVCATRVLVVAMVADQGAALGVTRKSCGRRPAHPAALAGLAEQ